MRVTADMIPRDLLYQTRLYRDPDCNPAADKRRSRDVWIPREDGSRFRLLVREPAVRSGKVPLLIWYHGGAYVSGEPEGIYSTMAKVFSLNCLTISPAYTLAEDSPYPAGLKDCIRTLAWAYEHSDELGVDRDRIYVGGESAGGALAISVLLYNRDHLHLPVAAQFPLYPMMDDRGDTESMRDNNAPVWDEKSNISAWRFYLRSIQGEVPIYAAPARAEDVSGLPPAISFVGGIEPFRDETAEYMEKLKAAGIPTWFEVFPGCYHMFDVAAPWSASAQRATSFFKRSLSELEGMLAKGALQH